MNTTHEIYFTLTGEVFFLVFVLKICFMWFHVVSCYGNKSETI